MTTSRQSSFGVISDDSLLSDISEVSFANLSLQENDEDKSIPIDIFTAASIGHKEYFLPPNYFDVNSQNRSGWSALMYASYFGHSKLIEILLKNGADVELKNNLGCTALMLAAMCGKEECCRILISNGGKLESVDDRRWNSLFYAVYFNHHSVVSLLLKLGASPNVKENTRGFTPLSLAVYAGLELCVEYLLQFNADVTICLQSGGNSRDLAVQKNHTKILMLIDENLKKRFKKSPNVQDLQMVERFVCKKEVSPRVDFTKVKDLRSLLEIYDLQKHYSIFKEQNIDLDVFLTLTDNDLKELGIVLLGPRRKMTCAIARWHSSVPIKNSLEETYANKLEVDMQELGIALQKAMFKIDELEKYLAEEKRVKKIYEECFVKEKNFAQDVVQLCFQIANHVQKIQSDNSCLEKQLTQIMKNKSLARELLPDVIENISLETNILENNLKKILSITSNQLKYLEITLPKNQNLAYME